MVRFSAEVQLTAVTVSSLTECDRVELEETLAIGGFVRSHARPLLREFYRGMGEIDFSRLRCGPRVAAWVASRFQPIASTVLRRVVSADGTVKLLVGFPAGGAVESVLMPSHRPDRAACCVSSQIGCAMGCDFCASTRGGLERNLSAAEIVEQFLHLKREALSLNRRLTSLVFMGMGEPMVNLANVIAAIRRIADPDLGGLGWRQITVSTVGVVPGIDRLADADLNVHLALSLHAPDDETRAKIVPANRRYPVTQIMAAVRRFAETTGRIPTLEYCLLADINDSDEHARMLGSLMAGFRAHVNLIPYNWVGAGLSGTVYRRPDKERMKQFARILGEAGAVAHFRDTRGDDVNAACGQLRQVAMES
jgi:23S rRNA (adenine2503-C2)-methyltransferase